MSLRGEQRRGKFTLKILVLTTFMQAKAKLQKVLKGGFHEIRNLL